MQIFLTPPTFLRLPGLPNRLVFCNYLPNEIPDFWRYGWAGAFAVPTLPLPIESKTFAMPSDNSLVFDDERCRPPIVQIVPQLRDSTPQHAVTRTEGQSMASAQTPGKSTKDWWPISTRAETWSGSTTRFREVGPKTLEAESLPAVKMRIA